MVEPCGTLDGLESVERGVSAVNATLVVKFLMRYVRMFLLAEEYIIFGEKEHTRTMLSKLT